MTKEAAILATVLAACAASAAVEITPAVQKEITRQTEVVKGWAASPAIVKAVLEQNEKGPIPGITNETWKSVRRGDSVVKGLVENDAGRFLARKVEESDGLFLRAFLCAARGEKAAFTEKTIAYLHRGSAKFDVPFGSGKTWQGVPELDVLTEAYDIQVAAPVLSDGKPAGVLVVGLSLKKLEKIAGK
jgi:hypothetical protein